MNLRNFLGAMAGTTVAISLFAASPAPSPVAPPAAPRVRISPHETISLRVDDNRVIVVYGRPYSKDPKTGAIRKIWGTLVPPDKVWRTGSDEATLLITQRAIDLGGTTLPAGSYSLYTFLAADGSAQLIVNKAVGQWGSDPYDDKQDFARIPLTKETLSAPLDQFTMALEKNSAGGGVLKLAWEDTQYSVAYSLAKK